jgi:N utilization substance protein B
LWFASLTRGAWRQAPELDPMIGATLAEGWSLERAGYLLRAFLRAGAYELASQPDVPVSVVINEYVELAHAFLSRDEARFINAVLDRLATQLRPGGDDPAQPPSA